MSNDSLVITDAPSAAGTPERDSEYSTINMLGFVRTIRKRKKTILIFALVGLAIGAIAAYVITPKYDANVRFLPPTQHEMSALSLFPTTGSGDKYLGLVSSRTVADDVIEHQHLAEYFHARNASDARRRLTAMSKIEIDKDQFVTVTVRAKEPQTAVAIANEYLDALYRLNHSISLAESNHRVEYFGGPLLEEKDRLADAEEQLKRAQQKTGMVLPDAQMRLEVSSIANLKQEITSRESQLASLLTGSTEENPQVVRLRSQITSLQAQVSTLERQNGGLHSTQASAQFPELMLEVERKARDVKFHELLFQVLSRQYENAQVDQSYTQSIELVDRAVLPDEKSWPPRKLFMALGLLLGGILGMLYGHLRASETSRLWKEELLTNDGSS